MPIGIIISVITWIIENPETVAKGAQFVLDKIEFAIAVWKRWQSGTMTDAELEAAWTGEGIKMAEVRNHWRQRHPIVEPT